MTLRHERRRTPVRNGENRNKYGGDGYSNDSSDVSSDCGGDGSAIDQSLDPARSAFTRIITICVLGTYRAPTPRLVDRIQLLRQVVAALTYRADWGPIDAVLLPGGYLHTGVQIGHLDSAQRRIALEKTPLGRRMVEVSVALDQVFPGAVLITGIDSAALSRKLAGDQLVAAWQNGQLLGLTRKAFPVASETKTRRTAVWVSPRDADDPSRCVLLPNGRKAVLLACYDAFAVRALKHPRFANLSAIRLLGIDPSALANPSGALRQQYLMRWISFQKQQRPDLALVAIHHFDRPGRDGYWQRHGLAGASAALGGRAIIGAAHFECALPKHGGISPLAARDVPMRHLNQGTKRAAHRFRPSDSFTLVRTDGQPVALIRLFEINHERNRS